MLTRHLSYNFIVCLSSRTKASDITKSTGCKGKYSLMKLPHHNPIELCHPDPMHTVKDVIEHVFNLNHWKRRLPQS